MRVIKKEDLELGVEDGDKEKVNQEAHSCKIHLLPFQLDPTIAYKTTQSRTP